MMRYIVGSKALLGLAFAAMMLISAATLADEPVRVESLSGTVQFRVNPGDSWQTVSAGMVLPAPADIKTSANSEAVLVQSGSKFELKSGSQISLKAGNREPKGLITRIKQWFGTVFYTIERQPDQFSVETPFLVSTVKGTRFVIVSNDTSSLVTLTEGSLEIEDLASGETQMLAPGEIAGAGASQAGVKSFKQTPSKTSSRSEGMPAAAAPGEVVEGNAAANDFSSALDTMTEVATQQQVEADTAGDNGGSPGSDDGGNAGNANSGGGNGGGGGSTGNGGGNTDNGGNTGNGGDSIGNGGGDDGSDDDMDFGGDDSGKDKKDKKDKTNNGNAYGFGHDKGKGKGHDKHDD
ncbi:FecR family protein [Marinobacter sp. BGYM27]|uniref:FecR family protein n=1 Tax=Marinobacter sp. BGYM27 TaxID=2975597 RepID=UPI0021A71FA9|nr:FecR family protein [Marinobacter sp. BGYM27]MDG5501396.1 FecR family protein [Marinobacter sp. BGYM27]